MDYVRFLIIFPNLLTTYVNLFRDTRVRVRVTALGNHRFLDPHARRPTTGTFESYETGEWDTTIMFPLQRLHNNAGSRTVKLRTNPESIYLLRANFIQNRGVRKAQVGNMAHLLQIPSGHHHHRLRLLRLHMVIMSTDSIHLVCSRLLHFLRLIGMIEGFQVQVGTSHQDQTSVTLIPLD